MITKGPSSSAACKEVSSGHPPTGYQVERPAYQIRLSAEQNHAFLYLSECKVCTMTVVEISHLFWSEVHQLNLRTNVEGD